MQTFIDPDLLDRLRVGPLASYLDAYLKRIEQEGFFALVCSNADVWYRQIQQLAPDSAARLAPVG
jgi:hypothetical protein